MIGKTIAELAAGNVAELTRVVEVDDVAAFVDAVGDDNPVHSYEEPARPTGAGVWACQPWTWAAHALSIWSVLGLAVMAGAMKRPRGERHIKSPPLIDTSAPVM